jgi:hypothetical protein
MGKITNWLYWTTCRELYHIVMHISSTPTITPTEIANGYIYPLSDPPQCKAIAYTEKVGSSTFIRNGSQTAGRAPGGRCWSFGGGRVVYMRGHIYFRRNKIKYIFW